MLDWHIHLDKSLPAPLGTIGAWLYRAEAALREEVTVQQAHEETANTIHRKLEQHKVDGDALVLCVTLHCFHSFKWSILCKNNYFYLLWIVLSWWWPNVGVLSWWFELWYLCILQPIFRYSELLSSVFASSTWSRSGITILISTVKFRREFIILGALFNRYELIGWNRKKGTNALTLVIVSAGDIHGGRKGECSEFW